MLCEGMCVSHILYSLVYHQKKSFDTAGHSIYPVKKMSIDCLEEQLFVFTLVHYTQYLLINHITLFIPENTNLFFYFVAQ